VDLSPSQAAAADAGDGKRVLPGSAVGVDEPAGPRVSRHVGAFVQNLAHIHERGLRGRHICGVGPEPNCVVVACEQGASRRLDVLEDILQPTRNQIDRRRGRFRAALNDPVGVPVPTGRRDIELEAVEGLVGQRETKVRR
jgi:hypothetical protein